MHSESEYAEVIQHTIKWAEDMVDYVVNSKRPRDVMDFLNTYGCSGRPCDEVNAFRGGRWLNAPGSPKSQRDTITIVPCFSDDKPPVQRPSTVQHVFPACFNRSGQAIVLFDVEYWSLGERALFLLHEAYHARHRFGPTLAKLPPLDTEDDHEANAWLFTLDILDAWGGKIWEQLVDDEVAWIADTCPRDIKANQMAFGQSGIDRPGFVKLFERTNRKEVYAARRGLLSVKANIVFWTHRNPAFSPLDICRAFLRHAGK